MDGAPNTAFAIEAQHPLVVIGVFTVTFLAIHGA